MIICIDCVDKQSILVHYNQNAQHYPIGECRVCHKQAPLTDSYRQTPGKYFDTMGNELAVGDTIAYSVKAGRSSGKMVIGNIYKINPRTICVEVETIEWNYTTGDRTIELVKTHFNYHPSKCLKLNSPNQ